VPQAVSEITEPQIIITGLRKSLAALYTLHFTPPFLLFCLILLSDLLQINHPERNKKLPLRRGGKFVKIFLIGIFGFFLFSPRMGT
jgi:hypothetical protein